MYAVTHRNAYMPTRLPKLVATSVVRGSQQGESHGGIFTVDFETRDGEQHVDWNTSDIDFEGRGADRGLRGIAFDGNDIYVAASDELFVYDREFDVAASHRNRYLKHAHEIVRKDRHLFVTSTGFDSLLAFNLDTKEFDWAYCLQKPYEAWSGFAYDPCDGRGPRPVNDFHINAVHVDATGIYVSGLRTQAVLHITSEMTVREFCSLPVGTHNAQRWKDGVLFNDTASDCVRFVSKSGEQLAFPIVRYDDADIEFAGIDDSSVARQAFGRGLCVADDRFIAGGSSPSTISLYDAESHMVVGSVNLSMDIRNAIHGLEVWPYD